MNKFKVGDKVRYIEETDTLVKGDVYTVVKLKTHTGGVHLEGQPDWNWWYERRFELVEEKAETVTAAPEKLLLEISYNGITVKFDPSVRSGEWLAQGVISTIYKEAA